MLKISRQGIWQFSKQAIIYILLFSLIALAVDWWRGRNLPKNQVPLFIEKTLLGQTIDLQEKSEGQVVVVYFWATWCGPCRVTSPSISSLSRFYPVVSVAMQSGTDSVLLEYLTKHDYKFPVINDPNRRIADEWNIPVTPMVVFVKNGKIVDYTSGISLLPALWWRAFRA